MRTDVKHYFDFWIDRLGSVRCTAASPGDVLALQEQQGLSSLPASYEAFLLVAGKGCGDLWIGSDMFLPPRFNFRTAAEELLRENGLQSFLGVNNVVIGMHQGYQFLFFSESGDDPAVSRWSEGRIGRVQIADSFTSLVTTSLENVI